MDAAKKEDWLRGVRWVVVDEADRLMGQRYGGWRSVVERLARNAGATSKCDGDGGPRPKKARPFYPQGPTPHFTTVLVSATRPPPVQSAWLCNPLSVTYGGSISSSSGPNIVGLNDEEPLRVSETITEAFVQVTPASKILECHKVLSSFVEGEEGKKGGRKAVAFCNSKATCHRWEWQNRDEEYGVESRTIVPSNS